MLKIQVKSPNISHFDIPSAMEHSCHALAILLYFVFGAFNRAPPFHLKSLPQPTCSHSDWIEHLSSCSTILVGRVSLHDMFSHTPWLWLSAVASLRSDTGVSHIRGVPTLQALHPSQLWGRTPCWDASKWWSPLHGSPILAMQTYIKLWVT